MTQTYWPDGGEAAGLPDSFLGVLAAKAKTNPRFADPNVKVIGLDGRVVCEAQYGWNPTLSPDDKHIVFSDQLKPITGHRELAASESGNGIRLFDCEKKQTTKIADPRTGYFDEPFFSSDGTSVVYTQNEAVNGSYAGVVGISSFDLSQNREVSLLSKKTVAALPCPPIGSEGSTRQSLGCSQGQNLSSSFPQIVFGLSLAGNDVIAMLGMPIPAPGDMYLASTYDVELVSLVPERRTVIALGKHNIEGEDQTAFQAVADGKVLIYSRYWKVFSLTTGQQLGDPGPRNARLKSSYSPDLKYYLSAEPEDGPDRFVLYRTSDGKRVQNLRKMQIVYEAVWSSDSRRFAVTGVPIAGVSAMNHREDLTVYSIP